MVFFLEKLFFLISRFMLFPAFKKMLLQNIEKCPFTRKTILSHFISRLMLFPAFKKMLLRNIEKFPFTYSLTG